MRSAPPTTAGLGVEGGPPSRGVLASGGCPAHTSILAPWDACRTPESEWETRKPGVCGAGSSRRRLHRCGLGGHRRQGPRAASLSGVATFVRAGEAQSSPFLANRKRASITPPPEPGGLRAPGPSSSVPAASGAWLLSVLVSPGAAGLASPSGETPGAPGSQAARASAWRSDKAAPEGRRESPMSARRTDDLPPRPPTDRGS